MSVDGQINVPVSIDAVARVLDRDPDFRVLRRMQGMVRHETHGFSTGVLRGVAIDVETTGLDQRTDRVIELALQTFEIDAAGRIVATGTPRGWLEDPKVPITAEITRITGLRGEDVRNKAIADGEAGTLIAMSDLVVSHNAAFDRPFVDERLDVGGLPWACSFAEIDWRGLGFEGRALSVLLGQMGLFYSAHRAGVDVTALLHLLDHQLPDGRSVVSHLVESARRPSFRLIATDAPYAARALLKARGWRWDADRRHWWTEQWQGAHEIEAEWATIHVYKALRSPDLVPLDWTTRYAA